MKPGIHPDYHPVVFRDRSANFTLLTKSTLILRDLDLLRDATSRADVSANFSIGTLDEEVWKLTEPGTPHPRQRVEAVAKLNEALAAALLLTIG